MAILTNHLVVRTLMSPELQNDDALLERIKKMPRSDRVELIKALETISKSLSLPQPQPLSERGVDTLLLADAPEAPYDPEYNYSFELFASHREHSNANVMKKIKSVRSALLKIYPGKSALVNPEVIIASHWNRIQKLAGECRVHTEEMRSEKHDVVLQLLDQVEKAIGDIKKKDVVITDSKFYELFGEFHHYLKSVFGGPETFFAREVAKLYPLFVLLTTDASSIEDLQRRAHINGIVFYFDSSAEFSKNIDDPVSAVISKQFEIKFNSIRGQLQRDLEKLNSRSQAQFIAKEEERAVLERRLNHYVSHYQRLYKASIATMDEFYNIGSPEAKALEDQANLPKELKAIQRWQELMLNICPESQELNRLSEKITTALREISMVESCKLTEELSAITILLQHISLGSVPTIKSLLGILGKLHELCLEPRIKTEFEKLSRNLTKKYDSVRCADQELIEVIREAVAFVMLVLDRLEGQKESQLAALKRASIAPSAPSIAPASSEPKLVPPLRPTTTIPLERFKFLETAEKE